MPLSSIVRSGGALARLRFAPQLDIAFGGEDQAVLHRDAATEMFDPRQGFRRRVFEMGKNDALARQRRRRMDLLDHV